MIASRGLLLLVVREDRLHPDQTGRGRGQQRPRRPWVAAPTGSGVARHPLLLGIGLLAYPDGRWCAAADGCVGEEDCADRVYGGGARPALKPE